MNIGLRGAVLAVVSLCALALGMTPVAGAPATPVDPIVLPVAADPSVVRAPDGTFYLYATSDNWADGHGMRLIPIFTSRDLVNWRYVGTAFSARPSWAPSNAGLWSPDVHRVAGGYVMYYSVGGVPNPCVGMATATSPTGPWTDLGRAVLCSDQAHVPGAIDPSVWIADDGSKTMFVGNFHGIFAVPLTADGTAAAGAPVQVADDRFEAPYIEHRGGYYYLYVSAGNCCRGDATAYRVLVGRSTSLTGPYLDRHGVDLNKGGGELILAGSDAWAGPGHNAVVTDDAGDDWIVYHAAPRNDATLPNGTQRREGMIDRIVWVNDWPKVGDGSPGNTAPEKPAVDLPVRVSLVRSGASTVPAGGGTIAATMTVTAPAGSTYTGQVWAAVTAPDGSDHAISVASPHVTVPAGQSVDVPLSYAVPGTASAGTYVLTGSAGQTEGHPDDFAVLRTVKEGAPPAPPSGGGLGSLLPPGLSAS